MPELPWIVAGIALAVAAGLLLLLRKPIRRAWRAAEARRAVHDFRFRREQLEARFFDMARTRGKPKGLRWVGCDWGRDVVFARDANTGQIAAFVAVNVRFEAIEGGDMEGVEAVSTVRDAAAVFHYRLGQWGTGGRALFNMNPGDAVTRLEGQYEPVEVG